MKRRNFLKSLISAGVMLSPISAIVQTIQVPGVPKEVTPESAFDRSPYSILIQNLSDRTIPSVDIFGSIEYVNNPGFTNANRLLINDVEISSLTEGKAYVDMLYDLSINPTIFEKMVVERSEREGFYEPISFFFRDASGIRLTIPIEPAKFKTPYDENADSFCMETAFRVDCMTKIIFHNLRPGEKIAARFYPGEPLSANELPDYLKKYRATRFN